MDQTRWGAGPDDWFVLGTLADLGPDLLPVVSNPHATISPDSKMAALGKTPSRYNRSRQAAGFKDWTSYRATPDDIAKWQKDSDYGICIQTRHVRALDVDVDDPHEAETIRAAIAAHLYPLALPCRWRRDGAKFLLAFAMPGEFTKRRFKTAHGMVEFLATGQQFIASGTHPKGARYEWTPALPDSFPVLPADAFEALWQALVERFAVEGDSTSSASIKREKLANAKSSDPVAQYLIDHDYVLSEERDGRLHITCPFEHEHTTESAESATTYWPAHTGGYANGHFHCLHAHCEHRTDGEFKDAIGYCDETILAEFEDLAAKTVEAPLEAAQVEHQTPDRNDQVDQSAAGAQPEGDARPVLKYRALPLTEFVARPAPKWIIKGVIPRAELVVLYGESGSGKTFATLDLVMAIARGIPWRDLRVTQGRVAYIAAEGAGGFRNRAKAYLQEHDLDATDLPFTVIHAAPNLLEKADALEVCKAILEHGKADLVVVDTLAQTMPGGNENAGEDIGKVLAHCKGINRATGATVLLVHHSGKDSTRGARGWSGLRAAADAEVEITRDGDDRILRISKQKDGNDAAEWGFRLSEVLIGTDEDGDAITSCVVEPAEVKKQGTRKLGRVERLVAEVVGEIGLSQTEGIEVAAVLAEVVKRMPAPEGKRDTRKQHAQRALAALCTGDDAPYLREDDCLSIL